MTIVKHQSLRREKRILSDMANNDMLRLCMKSEKI